MEIEQPTSTIEVQKNVRISATVIELPGGEFARGTISRVETLAKHPENVILADDAEKIILAGDTLQPAIHRNCTRCGDGRGCEHSNGGNQIFGGTAGVVKSRVIAGVTPLRSTLAETIGHETALRTQKDIPSGAHRAGVQADGKCGCGECDGGQDALENYFTYEESLKPLVIGLWGELGFIDKYGTFDEASYSSAMANLRTLLAAGIFADGPSQVQAVEDNAAPDSVEELVGAHKEVFWVINTIDGMQNNQSDFLEKFDAFAEEGKGIQVFWEDQWSITEEIIKDIATEQHPRIVIADLVRRIATAANLTKADLKLVILKDEAAL